MLDSPFFLTKTNIKTMQNELFKTELISLLMSPEEFDDATYLQRTYEQFVEELYLFIQTPFNQATCLFTLYHTRIELQALQLMPNSKAMKKYREDICFV